MSWIIIGISALIVVVVIAENRRGLTGKSKGEDRRGNRPDVPCNGPAGYSWARSR